MWPRDRASPNLPPSLVDEETLPRHEDGRELPVNDAQEPQPTPSVYPNPQIQPPPSEHQLGEIRPRLCTRLYTNRPAQPQNLSPCVYTPEIFGDRIIRGELTCTIEACPYSPELSEEHYSKPSASVSELSGRTDIPIEVLVRLSLEQGASLSPDIPNEFQQQGEPPSSSSPLQELPIADQLSGTVYLDPDWIENIVASFSQIQPTQLIPLPSEEIAVEIFQEVQQPSEYYPQAHCSNQIDLSENPTSSQQLHSDSQSPLSIQSTYFRAELNIPPTYMQDSDEDEPITGTQYASSIQMPVVNLSPSHSTHQGFAENAAYSNKPYHLPQHWHSNLEDDQYCPGQSHCATCACAGMFKIFKESQASANRQVLVATSDIAEISVPSNLGTPSKGMKASLPKFKRSKGAVSQDEEPVTNLNLNADGAASDTPYVFTPLNGVSLGTSEDSQGSIPKQTTQNLSLSYSETSQSFQNRLSNLLHSAKTLPLVFDGDKDPEPSISMIMPCDPRSAVARHVANSIIRHARYNKTANENSMACPDCGLLPLLPVTGVCGHTRCSRCIKSYGSCPCGAAAPSQLLVNTLIQDLIKKIDPTTEQTRSAEKKPTSINVQQRLKLKLREISISGIISPKYRSRRNTSRYSPGLAKSVRDGHAANTLLSPQSRFRLARGLLVGGRYKEAAAHLARVAASYETASLSRLARSMLVDTIAKLIKVEGSYRLTRDLYRSVRKQSAGSWLQRSDLECVLCYLPYTRPVTTPCGHNYCRTCLERCLDYRKCCALCLRSLEDLDLGSIQDTAFLSGALASLDALNPPLTMDPDVIPIFVCTVAYPSIPCPLFIFDPRYWLMIRRVLESGSRKFGMVAYERDGSYSDYGTVLEVCDCVHFEDGRSILSTVGVSRFKVITRDIWDGCDVARIESLVDIPPNEGLVMWEICLMARIVWNKALKWVLSMSNTVRAEIEGTVGEMPKFYPHVGFWEKGDGPVWMWWLVSILPLKSEIKVLILSTTNLLKRLNALDRILEVIDNVALNATTSSDDELRGAFTDQWLERHA